MATYQHGYDRRTAFQLLKQGGPFWWKFSHWARPFDDQKIRAMLAALSKEVQKRSTGSFSAAALFMISRMADVPHAQLQSTWRDTMAGLDGLKTGFINASGYNLAASAVRDNHRLIAVVLGGSSTASRNNNVELLLNTGFDIMRRRDSGETLLITQNLFETPPAAAAPTLPGPGLPPSGQVVLTDGPAPANSLQIVTGRAGGLRPALPVSQTFPADSTVGYELRGAVAAPPPPRPPQAARPATGRYSIQVGAFRNRAQAKDQLAAVTRRFAVVRGHRGDVGSLQGGYFRAQFGGFTQDSAKEACAALKAKRVSCMVIAP